MWEFGGGQIAIQPSAGGTFTGTVVVATKFAECTHPVDEQIWTEITPPAGRVLLGLSQMVLRKIGLRTVPHVLGRRGL